MRNRLHRIVTLVAAFAVVTTATALHADVDRTIPEDDWKPIKVGNAFTVNTPPGFHYGRSEGVDSFVGTIEGHGIVLVFDYGYWSHHLNNDPEVVADYAREHILIHDAYARIVTWDDESGGTTKHFVGVHFPEIKKSGEHKVKLTVTTFLENDEDVELVKAIYRTINPVR